MIEVDERYLVNGEHRLIATLMSIKESEDDIDCDTPTIVDETE